MFWECHVTTSTIDKLLDQPHDQLNLQDFLDENDLIQECLNQNQRLIDYLIEKNVMKQLIEQIIFLPKDENFRNATIVSELLSGDFQRIQECLLLKENLDLLFSFLTTKQTQLNPILASYFSRIINTLILRKTTNIIHYLKASENVQRNFLNHLYSTSITDILFHLISDSGEQRSEIIQFYEDINLIDDLMKIFVQTDSKSIQNNLANLFSEFLRLAFDRQTGIDCDFAGPTLSATIERLLNNRHEYSEGSSFASYLSSNNDEENKSSQIDNDDKLTPIILAEHILSKTNLEQLFDTITTRSIFVSTGCDFLCNIFDLFTRHLPTPISISLLTTTTTTDIERMQVNDEVDGLPVTKSDENLNTLINLSKEPLMKIYLLLIEIIPSRLSALINLLSISCPPLVPTNDNLQLVKYQFISEPLGSIRLNLIRFLSKLIQTISNDYTGEKIYEMFDKYHLFSILLDLFLRHIYNNFFHTQIYLIIRLIIHINSLAVKQPTDIWSRTILSNLNQQTYHYTNRCSYKLFQSILNSSEINLFERLIDQYELNIASKKSILTSSTIDDDKSTATCLHTRFTSPNSGHIAQILRCLRDHASIFNNYLSFFKSNKDEQIDDETNVLEIRWQATLDYLNDDEKKWSAMHYTERTTNNFRINSSGNYLIHATNMNESNDGANQRRQNFHTRSFGNSGTPYVDEDDDDDEIERFDIDDETMKNDQTTNERKVADMKKISFEPTIPTNFTEQTLWYQQDETVKDNDKLTSAPTLPDLFENHRNQHEKLNSSTESNFEQLCSIRANDNGSGLLFPFQSSSTIRDEATGDDDVFWKNHPIYLKNSTENPYLNKSRSQLTSSSSSSSDGDHDINDEDESKSDANIPDDEKFFVHSEMETSETNVQPNNMMDIFRRQSSTTNDENNTSLDKQEEPILSSTPEKDINRRVLTFNEQDQQTNGDINSNVHDDDDEDELALQDNFSFLIAKGMLKSSFS